MRYTLFLDESGSISMNNGEKYFSIGGYLIETNNLKHTYKMKKIIKNINKDRDKNFNYFALRDNKTEVKFANLSYEGKKYVFNELNKLDGTFVAIIVDKENCHSLTNWDTNEYYNFLVAQLIKYVFEICNHAGGLDFEELKIIYDDRSMKVKARNDLQAHLIEQFKINRVRSKQFSCNFNLKAADSKVNYGVMISDLVKIDKDENVIAVSSLHRKSTPKYIIFVTKNGLVKKSFLEEYTKTNRNSGIAALKIAEGDNVVDILFQDDEDMVIITKNGMSIRFETKAINPIGRLAMGVKGITVAEGDEVVAAMSVHKETDNVAVFTEGGLGKKCALKDFPVQGRGGKGTVVYKPSNASGKLVGAAMIDDDDNILLVGITSSICISAKEVPLLGKPSQGNILIKNKVMSVTKI